ncbi:hypothetical protein BOTCAL_0688g00030 [Botryotinia calthae]|uniref:Uncharacterized protein n=1 Tax=Botryotinia calthae TaxID=38488 RepID=A0A4Y8CH73_9HELO|nr:hypothetical protein BOTCAL_0688g00030 [Botryotinia calthae]
MLNSESQGSHGKETSKPIYSRHWCVSIIVITPGTPYLYNALIIDKFVLASAVIEAIGALGL